MAEEKKKEKKPVEFVRRRRGDIKELATDRRRARKGHRETAIVRKRVKSLVFNPNKKRYINKKDFQVIIDVMARVGMLKNGRIRALSELHKRGVLITRSNLDYHLRKKDLKSRIVKHREALFASPSVPIAFRHYRLEKLQEIIDGDLKYLRWNELTDKERELYEREGITEETYVPEEYVEMPSIAQRVQALKEARAEMMATGKMEDGAPGQIVNSPMEEELDSLPDPMKKLLNKRYSEIIDAEYEVLQQKRKEDAEKEANADGSVKSD